MVFDHGQDRITSRLAGLAESDGLDSAGVPVKPKISCQRDVPISRADDAKRRLCSSEHSGGKRQGKQA